MCLPADRPLQQGFVEKEKRGCDSQVVIRGCGASSREQSTDCRTYWEEMASHTPCAAVMATGHLRLGQVAHAATGALWNTLQFAPRPGIPVGDGFKLRLWVPVWYPDPLPAGSAMQDHHPPFTPATCQLAFASKLGSEWSAFLLGERRGLQNALGATPGARHASRPGRVETSRGLVQMWV